MLAEREALTAQHTQTSQAGSQSDADALVQKINTLDQSIREDVLKTTIQTTQAEHTLLLKMMSDATNPGALAAQANKVMDTLKKLYNARAEMMAQSAGR